MNNELFVFFQVDIHTPDNLLEKFSEMCPLFVVEEIPEKIIPEHTKKYREESGRKKINGNKKLLAVTKTKKIILYSPLVKLYINHGLEITIIHQYLKYTPSTPLSWFTKEVSEIRREADKDPDKNRLVKHANSKEIVFYGKMIVP